MSHLFSNPKEVCTIRVCSSKKINQITQDPLTKIATKELKRASMYRANLEVNLPVSFYAKKKNKGSSR